LKEGVKFFLTSLITGEADEANTLWKQNSKIRTTKSDTK